MLPLFYFLSLWVALSTIWFACKLPLGKHREDLAEYEKYLIAILILPGAIIVLTFRYMVNHGTEDTEDS